LNKQLVNNPLCGYTVEELIKVTTMATHYQRLTMPLT